MSKSADLENDFQRYLWDGVRPSWDGAAQLFLSMHKGDPGEAGNQATNEADYTGYARKAIDRPGGMAVTASTAALVAQQVFGERTDAGATQQLTYLGVGTSPTGAGKLLHSYPLNSTINVDQNDSPYIPAGGLTIAED
jgi:hypothetical protein